MNKCSICGGERHWNRSGECLIKGKLIESKKIGSTNVNWKGDKAGYTAIHSWVRNRKTRPELCECCGKERPYDLANISQEYKRDINDFEWLCRRCHMKKDGRFKNLINFRGDTLEMP